MESCPIVFHMYPAGSLVHHISKISHEDHILSFINEEDSFHDAEFNRSHWTYGSRWHDFFPKLEIGLPNLTKFVFTEEEWNDEAFEMRNGLLSQLHYRRYIIFNGGLAPTPWNELRYDYEDTYELVSDFVVKTPAVAEPPCTFISSEDESIGSPQSETSTSFSNEATSTSQGGCQKMDEDSVFQLIKVSSPQSPGKG